MFQRRSIHPVALLAVTALAATVSCREQTGLRDVPDSVRSGSVRPAAALPTRPGTPSIQSLVLTSTKLVIAGASKVTPAGASTRYVVTVGNPTAAAVTGVFLQGEMVQGQTARGAGGFMVRCAATLGVLPPGTCTLNFTALASNATGGTGTLVAGPAQFVLRLLRSDGSTTTELDRETIPVLLMDGSATAP